MQTQKNSAQIECFFVRVNPLQADRVLLAVLVAEAEAPHEHDAAEAARRSVGNLGVAPQCCFQS